MGLINATDNQSRHFEQTIILTLWRYTLHPHEHPIIRIQLQTIFFGRLILVSYDNK